MKKIFAILLGALAFSTQSFALDNEPQPGLTNEVHLGMSLSRLRGFSGFAPKAGFNLGYKAEYTLPGAHGTFVNAGVDLTQKGSKFDGSSEKLNAFYAYIPIHVGFRYNVTSKIGTFADFGPCFGVGLGGKYKLADAKFFGNDLGDGKRFDCGLGFRVGGEYDKHLNLTFGFDWGLVDEIVDNPAGATALKNFCSTITVGYRF